MALWIVAYDDTKGILKRTTSDPSATGNISRVQRVALINGTTSVAVTFSSPMPDTNYAIVCTMQNVTDSSPQLQPIVITAFDEEGFTAKWNSPLDSGNYFLNYNASGIV